ARFFTMTGWRLDDMPATVEPRQPQLTALWCEFFGPCVGQTVWTLDDHGHITNFDRKPWVITAIQPAPSGDPYAFFAETSTGVPLMQCELAASPQGQATPVLFEDTDLIHKATT